jgi:iron complex transport system substrate-binding protein
VRTAWRLLAGVLALLPGARAGAAEPPRRVASLNLAADEILVDILPRGRLVAVTRFADEPGSSNVVGRVPPEVFRFPKADLERLVALAPDLVVLSEYTDADVARQIERSGLRFHRMRGASSVAGVREAILDLAARVGEEAAGRRLVARYDARLAELARRMEGVTRPRVLYWSNGMTAGADTAIGSLVETAGGTNVGRELGVHGIAPPGAERAFLADPDVILVGTWPGAVEAVRGHPLLGRARAAREGRVLVMPTELLVALSQYTADACWRLAALLHPDRVRPDGP